MFNQICYNNLFQSMQQYNFRNLNRVIFTSWKHLESWVNAPWHCFSVIKAFVYYFFIIFCFSPKDSPSKTMKNFFLFHLKISFHSQDIQIFVFLSFSHLLPVSHCFRACSKINLKVYDVINCLNKNLIIHFVWYFGKEKSYDIETLSINRVLNKKHFYEKIMQKILTKS